MWSVFQIYATAVSSLSILTNAFLLLISGNKKIDTFQELRYFLSNVAVAGMVFSVCNLFLQPQMVVRGSMTIRVPHGIAQHWPDVAVKALSGLAITAHMYNLLSFPVFFIYRCAILANNNAYGHYFTKRNMVFTLVIIFLFSAMEGAFFCFSSVDYDSLLDRVNSTSSALDQFKEPPASHLQILYTTTMASTGISGTSGGTGQMQTANDLALQQEAGNLQKRITLFGDDYQRNPILILFLSVALFGHLFAYIIVLTCAHLMLQALQKKAGSISFQARMAHELVVHAIFAEAFIPLVFSMPILANSILCLIYTDSLWWQEFLPECFISVVPLFSPLISIVFIKPYRNMALNYFSCGLKTKREQATRDRKQKENEGETIPQEIIDNMNNLN